MTNVPARTRDYIGPVTDTRIWDRFTLRPGDIVLSTPPKCGTTWSQAILMMLIHGAAVTDRAVWRESLWLDCGLRDQEATRAQIDAQAHRRCIKSHAPCDSIPYRADVIYCTVYRHPIDVHFSMQRHVENLVYDVLDFMFEGTAEENFDRFLYRPATDAGTDDLTLAAILHHYRSFAAHAGCGNLHFFHYATLAADLPGQIRRFALAAGLDAPEDLVVRIAEAASFGSMKATARAAPSAVGNAAFTEEHRFFDAGTSNKWEGRLTQAQLDAYNARMRTLATAQERVFLETGVTAD